MRLTVIGATGMVGTRLVAEADRRGHRVVAAARRPVLDDARPRVRPVAVDVDHPRTLDTALADADAVVLTVRPRAGDERALTRMTSTVLAAVARFGTRLLVVGGAGPLRSPTDDDRLVVDDPRYVAEPWRAIATASGDQLRVCRAHTASRWTYLSPPALLEPGARTGRYRRGTTTLLVDHDGRSWISAEDLAVAVLDELERPSGDEHITVAHDHAYDHHHTGVPDTAHTRGVPHAPSRHP